MNKPRFVLLSGLIVATVAAVLVILTGRPSNSLVETLPAKGKLQTKHVPETVAQAFHQAIEASDVIVEEAIESIESIDPQGYGFNADEVERLLTVLGVSIDLSNGVSDENLISIQIVADSLPPDVDDAGMQAIMTAVHQNFPDEVGEYIGDFLLDYMRYRKQESLLFEGKDWGVSLESQADFMLQQMELRNRFFDEETQILLFGAAPLNDLDMLERRTANLDLRSAYRSGQAANLSTLSDKESAAASETQAVLDAALVMREKGINASMVRDYLVNQLGKDAADHLLLMDADEAEWLERYSRFAQQASIIESAGITDQEKDQQLDELIAQHYEPHEHTAAKAYFYSRLFEDDTGLPESRDL